VFSLSFVDERGGPARTSKFPDWPIDAMFLTTVTFADLNGKTQLTVRQCSSRPMPQQATQSSVSARPRGSDGPRPCIGSMSM